MSSLSVFVAVLALCGLLLQQASAFALVGGVGVTGRGVATSAASSRINLFHSKVPAVTSTRLNLFGAPEPPKSNNAPANKPGGGLFGGMGNMMGDMAKVTEMAKKMNDVQKELQETVVMGQDKEGQVFATFNGMAMPVGIKITDAALAQGSEHVSLAATQAMVDAHTKATQQMISKMGGLMGGPPR